VLTWNTACVLQVFLTGVLVLYLTLLVILPISKMRKNASIWMMIRRNGILLGSALFAAGVAILSLSLSHGVFGRSTVYLFCFLAALQSAIVALLSLAYPNTFLREALAAFVDAKAHDSIRMIECDPWSLTKRDKWLYLSLVSILAVLQLGIWIFVSVLSDS